MSKKLEFKGLDTKVVVLRGDGTFAGPIANICAHNVRNIMVWVPERKLEELYAYWNGEDRKRMPHLHQRNYEGNVHFTSDAEIVREADLIISGFPVAGLLNETSRDESSLESFQGIIQPTSVFLNLAKGISSTGEFPSQIIERLFSANAERQLITSLSGPNFAKDVGAYAMGTTIAGGCGFVRQLLKQVFDSPLLTLEFTKDIESIEMIGAFKNIYALAAGVSTSLHEDSESTHATLVRQSVTELTDLVKYAGGKIESILTFAGIGDIVLTCGSQSSRNFAFGFHIGELAKDAKQGLKPEEIQFALKQFGKTVEGLNSLEPMHRWLLKKFGSEEEIEKHAPLFMSTYRVFFRGMFPKEAVAQLFKRR